MCYGWIEKHVKGNEVDNHEFVKIVPKYNVQAANVLENLEWIRHSIPNTKTMRETLR